LKESLLNNKYLKVIHFRCKILILKKDNEIEEDDVFIFEKIFMYNHVIEKFDIDFYFRSIKKIIFRNLNLHHYFFLNFNLNFDLIFKF
jgi:hypothetical protein